MKLIRNLAVATALTLASFTAANAAEVYLQLDNKSDVDEAVKDILNDTIIKALNAKYPKNNFVLVVNYNVVYENNVCVYGVSMTGGYRDKANTVVINKALAPTDMGVGTINDVDSKTCLKAFGRSLIGVATTVFKQYDLNAKSNI